MGVTCFISHPWAGGFHHFAVRLARALRVRGIDVWLDEEKLFGGTLIPDRTAHGARRESDILLYALAAETLHSKACTRELEVAHSADKPIIVLRLDGSPMPQGVANLLYVDFTNPLFFDAAVDVLIGAVGKTARLLELTAVLDNDDSDLRIRAAALLAEARYPRAIRAICERLPKEPDPNVKYWFAIALAELADVGPSERCQVRSTLMTLLGDRSPRAVQGAREGIERLGFE